VSASATIKSLAFQNSGNLDIASGGTLQVTSGQLGIAGGLSTISGGTLTAPGDLTKTGSGVLDVRSRVVTGGAVNVEAGTLAANGEIFAKNIVVGGAATLAGSGTINAPVTVAGSLSPGNSIGTITVGSLTLNPGSNTLIEVASRSSNDIILVNGDAALGGTLQVVPIDGHTLSYGDRQTILVASGRISGEFDKIEVPASFRGRFLNSGKTGTLLLAPDTYTRVATTPNERNVAAALDSYIPVTSGDRLAVSIGLDSLTAGEYPAAFQQVSPAIYAALPMLVVEQAYNQAQLISQRLGFVRAGVGGGFQFAGLPEPELRYDRNGKSVIDPKTVLPLPKEAAVANWNAWVMGTGQFSNSNGWAGVSSARNNAGGFLAGVDYQWTDEFATGVFGGFQYNQLNYSGGGFAKGSGVSFGVYGAYSNDSGWYVDGVIGGGYTAFQTRRTIAFGTIDRTADADPGVGQFNISLNLGKDWNAGNLRFGPVAGIQYTYAGASSFTEGGADSLDLAVSPFDTSSLRSSLGARAAYLLNFSEKLTLVPELRALWMHEFLNGGETISSALDGGRGSSFDYQTGSTYADSLFAGAGLGLKFGEQVTASLFYNINFAGEAFLNNIISADVSVAF
jgi:outer membrane autotransporter protein